MMNLSSVSLKTSSNVIYSNRNRAFRKSSCLIVAPNCITEGFISHNLSLPAEKRHKPLLHRLKLLLVYLRADRREEEKKGWKRTRHSTIRFSITEGNLQQHHKALIDLLSHGTMSIIWSFQHHHLTANWPSLMQQHYWCSVRLLAETSSNGTFDGVLTWNFWTRFTHSTEKWRDWNFLVHKWPMWRTLTETFLNLANIWKTYFSITEPLRAEQKIKHWQECQRSHLSGQAHSRQFQKNIFRSCMWMKMKHTAAKSKSILRVTDGGLICVSQGPAWVSSMFSCL